MTPQNLYIPSSSSPSAECQPAPFNVIFIIPKENFSLLKSSLWTSSEICRCVEFHLYNYDYNYFLLKNEREKAGEIFWKSIKILCTFSFFNDKLSY